VICPLNRPYCFRGVCVSRYFPYDIIPSVDCPNCPLHEVCCNNTCTPRNSCLPPPADPSCSPSIGNLVQNPGFEDPIPFNYWSLPLGEDFSEDNSPHCGSYYCTFGCVGKDCPISQVITTVPGQRYVFGFWYLRDGEIPSDFYAYFGGDLVFSQVDSLAAPYQFYSFLVTASSSSTVILFTGRNDPAWDSLDDVIVVPY